MITSIRSRTLLTVAGCLWAATALAESPTVRRLTTTTAARNGQPFWSPDGSRISYVSNSSGSWQVWSIRADGTDRRQLTHMTEPVGWPSWSPDGRTIWFYAGSRSYRIFTLDVAGGVPKAWSERFSDFRPSLSPDGTKLLFDRYGATEPANHDLYVRDLGTGAETRLTHDPGYDSDGRWSPDGRKIAFHSDRNGSKAYDTRIYVMRADGSDLRRLTAREAKSSYPAWSPDGARIVYVLETEVGRDLWTAPLEGGVEQRLTDHPGSDSDPAWSPDGRRIVFATDRFGESTELAILELP